MVLTFAQNEPPFPGGNGSQPADSLWVLLLGGLWSVIYLAYAAFWIWMLIECVRKDPDRFLWLWILVLIPFPGALIYFFLRWWPTNDIRLPKSLQRWTRGKEIDRLATAAHQIGNAYQYVQLGEGLLEVRQFGRAGEAFARALQKEPDNPQALWGAAQVDIQHKEFDSARDRLKKLLDIDPQYKFGDVSLAYGKTLYEVGEHNEALEHLTEHVNRWRHPEALYLLASLHAERGELHEAREQLLAMLMDINGSPRAVARKYGIWKSRARKMLRKLPRKTETVSRDDG